MPGVSPKGKPLRMASRGVSLSMRHQAVMEVTFCFKVSRQERGMQDGSLGPGQKTE